MRDQAISGRDRGTHRGHGVFGTGARTLPSALLLILLPAAGLAAPGAEVNPAFAPLEWLAGGWQAEFQPLGEGTRAPTMAFEWGDDRHSYLVMTGTQPTRDGRLIPEYYGLIAWHPVEQRFVFLTVYRSGGGRIVEDGDIEIHEDGSVQLNMHVHYPSGAGLPFTDGATAGPDGHTLVFRRTFHREGADALRGFFQIKRGDRWETTHPEMGADGYLWRRTKGS